MDDVKLFGDDNPFTALMPNLAGGVDPDEVFSSVPYEKGFQFLVFLQGRCLSAGGDSKDSGDLEVRCRRPPSHRFEPLPTPYTLPPVS